MGVTYAYLWARRFGPHPGSHDHRALVRAPSLCLELLSPEIAMLVYGKVLQ